MARPRTFNPDDIPIPEDVQPHGTWPPSMLEMAAHIGAYDTLRVVEAFAGQDVYVPIDPARSPFANLISTQKAEIMADVYRRQRIAIPTGRNALLRARRQSIIAAIRDGRMSISEGAAIMRMNRRYMSELVNHSDEGTDCQPVQLMTRRHDPAQLYLFDEEPSETAA